MEGLKILMLLSNPFMVDPRVHKEATALVEAGHEVCVIVWDRKDDYTDEEVVDGVRIVRIHNSKTMNVLGHDLLRNPLWWFSAFNKAVKLFKNGFHFDVVHCHDLDTLFSGVLLKKKFGCHLVYDAHEIFGYMVARNLPKFFSTLTFIFERILIKNIDALITAEETYNDFFKKNGCRNISTILNCKELVINKYTKKKNDLFNILYIGVLNKSRFFPNNLQVIGNIDNVKFTIAGKKENLYSEVEQLSKKFNNINFLGSIPFNEVLNYTLDCDVVLCMINPQDINNKIASANKQFEAMVCGKPIICTKNTRSGQITEDEKCGVVIEYSEKALREAIILLRDSPSLCEKLGRNALNAATNKYNWETQKEKLLALYEKFKEKSI